MLEIIFKVNRIYPNDLLLLKKLVSRVFEVFKMPFLFLKLDLNGMQFLKHLFNILFRLVCHYKQNKPSRQVFFVQVNDIKIYIISFKNQ